jgi:hypothetical protein
MIRGVARNADLFALAPVSPYRVWRAGSPRSSGVCFEHDCQIRLSPRPVGGGHGTVERREASGGDDRRTPGGAGRPQGAGDRVRTRARPALAAHRGVSDHRAGSIGAARLAGRPRRHAGGDGGDPRLPGSPIPAAQATARPQTGPRGGQAHDDLHDLAHALHRRDLPRPRRRLLHHPRPRTPNPPPRHPSSNAAATTSRSPREPRQPERTFPVAIGGSARVVSVVAATSECSSARATAPHDDRVSSRIERQKSPRGPFRLLVESRLQGLYASRDVVAGRPALFGRTAESVVTDWPGGIPAGVEVALAPCLRIRVR